VCVCVSFCPCNHLSGLISAVIAPLLRCHPVDRITGLGRPSVCLSVMCGLLTQKKMK